MTGFGLIRPYDEDEYDHVVLGALCDLWGYCGKCGFGSCVCLNAEVLPGEEGMRWRAVRAWWDDTYGEPTPEEMADPLDWVVE